MDPDIISPQPTTTPTADVPAPVAPSSGSPKALKVIAAVLVLLILAGGGFALLKHQQKSPTKSAQPAPAAASLESGKQTEDQLKDFKQEVTVTITADGVTPQTLTIPNNSRINWMNKDKVAHKLVISPGAKVPPQFDDNHQIDPDGGYPFVLHQTGTFSYYIADQPTHSGTVVVK
ncbi:MAG: Plastocyanin [Candidatus Saccharibacteria bacterium]|nr:Plastocyanin [Candidatus Saccharibacteria bacterium]